MRKVLIVDDDEGVRTSLRMLLKDNYDLSFAIDGRDAIAKFTAVRPDLVLLDMCMPEMSGLEALRSMKVLDPHVVAIIITAFASLESAQDALRAGAFDYLIKPFEPAELESTIRRAIEHRIETLHLYLKCEAEQQRSLFLTYVSHELKTPLTPIVGAVDLLKNGNLGPMNDKQQQAVELAYRQTDRLHRLINDLLDHFKIENGCLTLHPVPTPLLSIIEESVDSYTPFFEKKGLSLTKTVPDDLPAALVDPQRFRQILDNLLENALKYTEEGGVTLQARLLKKNQIGLVVSDTGICINEKDIGRIFLPFYQVNSTLRGAGLGLTIVKQLVEAHGGTIHAESPASGKGCNISLQLPAMSPLQDGFEQLAAELTLT